MNKQVEEFVQSKNLPGRLIFGKVWGSRSHNTQKEGSDWDFSGVYLVPTRTLLGISTWSDKFCSVDGQVKPDYAFYEAGKFCNLLLVGNPGILEMLYTDQMCIETPEWLGLKKHRQKFLSKSAVNQYLGYAKGQLELMKSKGGKSGLHTKGGCYNEKWAYHLIRALLDADRIAVGCTPVVWKEDGPERTYLMNIRHGNVSQDEIVAEATKRVESIRGILADSTLPEVGDRELLEKWLVELRINDLG